jgi:hypothetical protein
MTLGPVSSQASLVTVVAGRGAQKRRDHTSGFKMRFSKPTLAILKSTIPL